MNDLELLQGTLDHLEQNGWTGGHYGPFEGPNCVVGAALHFVHQGRKPMFAGLRKERMSRRLVRILDLSDSRAELWNDRTGASIVKRTLAEEIMRRQPPAPVEPLPDPASAKMLADSHEFALGGD